MTTGHVSQHGVPTHALSVFDDCNIYRGASLMAFQSIFQYAIRHGLTTNAFTELLQLLSLHASEGASLPRSVYRMKNYFIQAFPESKLIQQHWYCSFCQRPLPSRDTVCTGRECSSGPPAGFVTVPISPQMKQIRDGGEYYEYSL